ncbi:LysR family transcriptional regulator [uncultured Maribacter sp.]|uniref:LysR family transcriptional regulator n=1 Tax=uncultured Maribacter sp. TaxID=431308 RepID=UPI0026106DFD|nr:LysR family transcriptional regulator [uncultured Maribacter sp.]
MNYTLHQLEIFKKVAELKSVTRASEELFLTQPAVSIQLKNFQDQFKIPLFEVIGRQLFITEFGEEIALAVQKILDEIKAINYKALSHDGKIAGKLKIAIVSTAKYVMPYLISDFIHINEGVDLSIDVTNKASVIKSLENNEVDFAMVSTIPTKLPIERIELMKNKLFLVGGRNYSKTTKNISKLTFEKQPIIFREKGSATRLAMEHYIAEHKLSISKKMELTSNEAIKQAIVAGLGFSIMPLIGIKSSLNTFELQIIPAKGLPIETTWNLIWMKSKNLSSVAKAFITHIEENKEAIIQEHFGWFENY